MLNSRPHSKTVSSGTLIMDFTADNHWNTSSSRHSSLARFTDRFRETMSLKRAPTPTPPQHSRAPSRAETVHDEMTEKHSGRRSSSIRYTDRMMMMFMSARRTSGTALNINELPVEILQHVFLDLDIFMLLRMRRVCKLWKSLIPGNSPLLTEDLFIKPSHNLHAYSFTMATFDLDFEINARSPHVDSEYLRSQSTYIDGLSMTRRCLGLIRTSGEIIFHPVIIDFNQYVQGDEFGRSKLVMHGDRPTEPVHWRNMLVSMPPLTELRISRTMGRKSQVVCVLKAKDGIRLGDLLELLDSWAESKANGSV